MKLKKLCRFLIFILLFCRLGYAEESQKIYSKAQKAVGAGNIDFAFMQFRALLSSHPDSEYAQDALFAIGEYYFSVSAYDDAFNAFSEYIDGYPDSESVPFALMYLLNIAEIQKSESLVKRLEEKIVTSRQLIFLFKDSKEHEYLSPLGKKHRVVYYIDRVEFYVEGELFAKIPY